MADSLAEVLTRINEAGRAQAVYVDVFYLGMGQSEAARSPGHRWAKWENLRRRAPRDLRPHLLPSTATPWWARREEA
jgi:hypothetical protein